MNTKIFLSLLLVSPLLLTSCKKELEPQESTPVAKSATDSTAVAATATQVGQNPAAAAAAAVTPSNASGGLNPAHGQPGHVCGTPVGAPLNSQTAVATPQQPTQLNSSKTTSITAAPTTKTAPGMNPPHGQPGHRCDISVGQPLNSAPTKTATQVNQSEKSAMTTTSTTINPDGTPSANTGAPAILNAPTTTAPGTNPPHGQPGHVCGTAVSAP